MTRTAGRLLLLILLTTLLASIYSATVLKPSGESASALTMKSSHES